MSNKIDFFSNSTDSFDNVLTRTFSNKVSKEAVEINLELDKTLDTISFDQIQEPVEDPVIELTYEEAQDKIVEYLSSNSNLFKSPKFLKSFNLELFSDALGYDISEYYADDDFNVFCNAILKGFIVGDKFEDKVNNPVKIFYVTPSKQDSIHLRSYDKGYSFYKKYPCISSFDSKSINKLATFFKNRASNFDSLYSYIKDSCLCLEAPYVDNKGYLLSFDNLELAKKIHSSKHSFKSCMGRLESLGCDKRRLSKISILYKTIKDNYGY